MIDSGDVSSIIPRILGEKESRDTPSLAWTNCKDDRHLRKLENETIEVIGKLMTSIICNNLEFKTALLSFVDDGHYIIVWRCMFKRTDNYW